MKYLFGGDEQVHAASLLFQNFRYSKHSLHRKVLLQSVTGALHPQGAALFNLHKSKNPTEMVRCLLWWSWRVPPPRPSVLTVRLYRLSLF